MQSALTPIHTLVFAKQLGKRWKEKLQKKHSS